MAENYTNIWATAGVHPHNAGLMIDLAELKELAQHEKVVAIGETGLDYFRDWSPREYQLRSFRAQIELALEVNKPLVIHSRNAAEKCFSILKEMEADKVGGVFHCFAEDLEFAERLQEINFIISIPGTVTFKKADRLREVARATPLERLMLETDAPYMAPEPHRGKRNESSYVVDIAIKIAEIKGMPFEKVAAETTRTALEFFKIS